MTVASFGFAIGALLSLAGLAFARKRRDRRIGLAVCLAGICLLMLSVTSTHPVLNRLGLSNDVMVLQDQVLSLERERGALRATLADRKALEKLNGELHATIRKERNDHFIAKDRLAVVNGLLNKAVESNGSRIADQRRLAETLAVEQTAHRKTAADLESARTALAKTVERYPALEASSQAPPKSHAPPGTKLAPEKNISPKVSGRQRGVSADLARGFALASDTRERPHRLQLLAERGFGRKELPDQAPRTDGARGCRGGAYFRIDLRNAIDGSAFVFPAGRFELSADRDLYRKALVDLSSEIRKQLPDPNCYLLYLQGHADAGRPAVAQSGVDQAYRRIEYYPARTAGKFGTNTSVQILRCYFENQHLPNLRAKFTRRQLEDVFPNVKMAILEGLVSSQFKTDYAAYFRSCTSRDDAGPQFGSGVVRRCRSAVQKFHSYRSITWRSAPTEDFAAD